jgi:uncharacterized protein YpbB
MMTLAQYQHQEDLDDRLFLRADHMVCELLQSIEKIDTQKYNAWYRAFSDAIGETIPEDIQDLLWDEKAQPTMSLDAMKDLISSIQERLTNELMEALADENGY